MKFYSRNDGYSTPSFFCDRQVAPNAPTGYNEVRPVAILLAIMNAASNGNKIALIKMLRSLTNLGLKEAKDEVESIPTKWPSSVTANDSIDLIKVFIKWVPELQAATQEIPAIAYAFIPTKESEKLAKELAKKLADEAKKQAIAEHKYMLEQEKRKQKERKEATLRQRKAVMAGVACAYDNARILGYDCESDAMRDVISRLEQNRSFALTANV